jgi:outer membrane immunogenic protein
MDRLSTACLAAIASIGLVQAASAADMPVKARAPAVAAMNWTGFYIGANAGYGWGHRSTDYTPNDGASGQLFDPALAGAPPPSGSFTSSGAIGGLQLGYNWQFNRNWLIGLETDFNWAGLKGSNTAFGTNSGVPMSATVDERIKWFGTARARLGYLPADNLLAYVTAGLAYGRVERSASYNNISAGTSFGISSGGISFNCLPASACYSGSSGHTAAGWTTGGGFEYAFAKNWTFKGEYLYISLESKSTTETARVVLNPGETPSTFNANFGRTTFNVARVGVNYRF